MKINNKEVKNKLFAYDGCHKIYLLENESEIKEAKKTGYNILPIEKLEEAYNNSCSLKFINMWKDCKTIIEQFKEAIFE